MRPRISVLAILAIFMAIAAAAGPSAQTTPPRVDTDTAMKQLVKRVEPEIPEVVKTNRVGGTVIAEIIVGTNGRVESVRITQPVAFLSGVAADAIREWEFTPFLIGGKASRVVTSVSVHFPTPASPEREAEEAYVKAATHCRTLVESQSPDAVAACEHAVRLAQRLPAENWARRSEALFLAAQSLMHASQFAAAIGRLEESLALWLTHDAPHVRVAEHYLVIALAHLSNRDRPKANEGFARALKAYDDRIAAGLAVDQAVARELETLLINYAELRRAMGDTAGAKALEARAAKIPGATPPAPPPPTPRRVVAGVPCFDVGCDGLSDANLADALTRLPSGTRPWFVDGGSFPSATAISVYLESDRELPQLRRGRMIVLVRAASGSSRFERPKPGSSLAEAAEPTWAQIAIPGRAASDLEGKDDPAWPFTITSLGRSGALADADLQAIVSVVTAAGEATRARNLPSPRLLTDVQPWPIGSIGLPASATQVNVFLRSPERGALPQIVVLTRDGKQWKVTGIGSLAR